MQRRQRRLRRQNGHVYYSNTDGTVNPYYGTHHNDVNHDNGNEVDTQNTETSTMTRHKM